MVRSDEPFASPHQPRAAVRPRPHRRSRRLHLRQPIPPQPRDGLAGHWPGYVLDRGGQTRAVLHATGLPLGINSEEKYPVPPALSLQPGELVVLLTDGIVEAASSDGKSFGLERTLGIVRAHHQETPDEILEALFDALRDFCANKFQDDVTAVIIKAEGVA